MKKHIRVEIPRSARDIVDLASRIVNHHDELGTESPISSAIDIDALKAILEEARTELEQSEKLRKAAEIATERRNNLVGISKDQTVTTKGTLLHLVASIRDILLGVYKGEEHQLGAFGFNVSSSSRSSSNGDDNGMAASSENGMTPSTGEEGTDSKADSGTNGDVGEPFAADD